MKCGTSIKYFDVHIDIQRPQLRVHYLTQ